MAVLVHVCVIAGLLLSTPAMAAEAPNRQTEKGSSPHLVAVIPYSSPEKIWFTYSPFVEYLSNTTGHPWQLIGADLACVYPGAPA